MAMEKRLCVSCHKHTWHNPGKREGTQVRWRCTYCGYPVTTTQEQKSSYQRDLMKKQVNKAGS